MLNFGTSKPRVKEGPRPPAPPAGSAPELESNVHNITQRIYGKNVQVQERFPLFITRNQSCTRQLDIDQDAIKVKLDNMEIHQSLKYIQDTLQSWGGCSWKKRWNSPWFKLDVLQVIVTKQSQQSCQLYRYNELKEARGVGNKITISDELEDQTPNNLVEIFTDFFTQTDDTV